MAPQDSFPRDSADHAPPVVASTVDDPFEVFGLWMNVQLSQLVAKWKHLAAPKAKRTESEHNRRFSLPRKPR